ncbi:hypothetical protein GCK72_014281 [Caenorhabditis remanei]|uniref:SGNH domain-containing protein n=1 Tax=Caenorhabditis remanei TaxID=31234 RepID=A0A6A5GT28_CAERE|nr:hypothetical protein GCK72_014281 [Caenorhabditis remanei]KAF1757824.1 hypothetical protein GCK72_014281 [Caenorhabditis remanei]
MFLQECRHRAYNVTMYSECGCEPLAALPDEDHCKRHLLDFVDFLESAKPDYAFIFTRFFATGSPFENNDTDLETDSTYKEMITQIDQFTPHIKKMAKDLKNGRKLEEIYREIVQVDTYKLARFRTESMVKKCGSKCELIDYEPLLFNQTANRFEFFDSKGFLYFTGANHLSAHGMELVRPIFSELCNKLS